MKEKSSAKQKISLPLNLFITLLYVIGYFFVAFIFYTFYIIMKLIFFLGSDFFQKGAQIFYMF